MVTNSHINPWKGLNFYVEGEIIYGRDQEIRNLSYYIFNNTQTVIYGRSGIGKSSLLNAGIFPLARENGMVPVTIRLKHSGKEGYIEQIRNGIILSGISIIETKQAVDAANESLWEFFHRHTFLLSSSGEVVTPLIVFDQFEEIFTLQSDESVRKAFFNDLADLLNNVKPLSIIELEKNESSDAKTSKSIDKGTFKGLSISLNFKGGVNGEKDGDGGYVENPHYHIVFAIREDFLSYLEIYSYSIPVMRNNRFALMPINEEQAAEIITKPIPGIVDIDVAKRIIEKVTGNKNFQLDGIPEIEVDVAILSLYLSRLYDKMIKEGKSVIDAELVETHSKDIIEDFYSDAIKWLPEKSINWLEDVLVNEDGRRDNRSRKTVLKECRLSESQLDHLINDSKLLRQFSYGGELRIEFIHDVMLSVIIQHRNNRVLLHRQQKTKRRNRVLLLIATVFLVTSLCFFFSKFTTYDQATSNFTYTLSVSEDSTITLSDEWVAQVAIISNSDTLAIDTLYRQSPSLTFQSSNILGQLPQIELFFLEGDVKADTICFDSNSDNHIKIGLTQSGNRKRITGKVISIVNSRAPINDAVVIIDDNYTETDFRGEFELYIDKDYTDNRIRIVKAGYDIYDGEINNRGLYVLRYTDEVKFYDEVKLIEQKVNDSQNKYSLSGPIYSIFKNKVSSGDAEMHFAIIGDKIVGYAYYLKQYALCSRNSGNVYDSYFLIKGDFDHDNNTFRIKMIDCVGNAMVYTGQKKGKTWEAAAFDKKDRKKKTSYFELD